MALHDLIDARREEVLGRWAELVRGRVAPESVPALELMGRLRKVIEPLSRSSEV
jgi:hypothetical protein